MRAVAFALLVGCHAAPSAPPAPAPEPPPPTAGSAECAKDRCGPVPGMMSKVCSDGSTGGPTGRCLEHDDHTCGWEIRTCP